MPHDPIDLNANENDSHSHWVLTHPGYERSPYDCGIPPRLSLFKSIGYEHGKTQGWQAAVTGWNRGY